MHVLLSQNIVIWFLLKVGDVGMVSGPLSGSTCLTNFVV